MARALSAKGPRRDATLTQGRPLRDWSVCLFSMSPNHSFERKQASVTGTSVTGTSHFFVFVPTPNQQPPPNHSSCGPPRTNASYYIVHSITCPGWAGDPHAPFHLGTWLQADNQEMAASSAAPSQRASISREARPLSASGIEGPARLRNMTRRLRHPSSDDLSSRQYCRHAKGTHAIVSWNIGDAVRE